MGLQPTGKTVKQREEAARKVRKSALRVIDRATSYDCPGRMIKLARAIEQGKYGEVTDVIVIVRGKANGNVNSEAYFYGKSGTETLHFMCARAAARCI